MKPSCFAYASVSEEAPYSFSSCIDLSAGGSRFGKQIMIPNQKYTGIYAYMRIYAYIPVQTVIYLDIIVQTSKLLYF